MIVGGMDQPALFSWPMYVAAVPRVQLHGARVGACLASKAAITTLPNAVKSVFSLARTGLVHTTIGQ